MIPGDAPLHPLVVHFPIVLLILAVITGVVASLPRLHQLRIVELVMLGAGLVAAVITKELGEQSEHAFSAAIHKTQASADVFQLHNRFADGVIIVFGLMFLLRLATWAWELWKYRAELLASKQNLAKALTLVIAKSQNVPLIIMGLYLVGSVAGLVLLTLTGYYGGELVYTYGIGIKS